MAKAGVEDILIATNIIGAARSGRLAALQRRIPLKLCADNPVSLQAYAEAGCTADRPVRVLVECDTGQKRAGVETPNEAVALAEIIRDDPRLEFGGLMFYPPWTGGLKHRCFWMLHARVCPLQVLSRRLFQPAARLTL